MTLSASKLELVMRCEGHLTLRQYNESNQWSDAGNESHAADEEAINTGKIPPEYEERWPGLTWRSEVSYAYDVATGTGRYLGMGLKRNYGPLGPFEIPGTIDAEGVGPGIVVIADKKSFEPATPAKDNPQLRFLALAAVKSEVLKEVKYIPPILPTRIFIAINHQLTGMDVAELDPDLDLDIIAEEIRSTHLKAADVKYRARQGLPVSFVTGRWCRWCSGFNGGCPEQEKLKALVKLEDENPELELKLYIDEVSAPDVYALYRRVGILHKRIGQLIHAWSSQHPIPIGPGKMYGMRNKLGNTKLNGDIAHKVLTETIGELDADAIITKSVTQKAMKSKMSPAEFKLAMKRIKDLGGAERKPTISFEEYDIGPKLVTEGDEDNE